MTISESQELAIQQGVPVDVRVGDVDCVLVRRDVFQTTYGSSDDDFSPEEIYPAVLEAWDAVGSPQDAEDYK